MDLKILWSSVSPTLGHTGYSKVTKNLLPLFKEYGFDVMAHGYHTTGQISEFGGVKLLPNGRKKYGEDVLKDYYLKYDRNLLITLYDTWTLDFIPNLGVRWAPYAPIDAEPVTQIQYEVIRRTYDRAVFTSFAADELKKVGLDSFVIPHGFDGAIFKPYSESVQEKTRKDININKNDFLVGTVCLNLYDRKDIPGMIKAFSLFVKRTGVKDAKFFLLTSPDEQVGSAFSLRAITKLYGMEDYVYYPSINPFVSPLPDPDLAKLYSAFDVYLSLSRAEAWNLPMLEAAACGVQSIFTDYAGPPSWYPKEFGYRVPVSSKIVVLTTPLHNEWAIADVEAAAQKLEEAYTNRKKLKADREKVNSSVKEFEWANVVHYYWKPWFHKMSLSLTEEKKECYHYKENSLVADLVARSGSIDASVLGGSKSLYNALKNKGIKVRKLTDVDKESDAIISLGKIQYEKDPLAYIENLAPKARKLLLISLPLGPSRDPSQLQVFDYHQIKVGLKPHLLIADKENEALLVWKK